MIGTLETNTIATNPRSSKAINIQRINMINASTPNSTCPPGYQSDSMWSSSYCQIHITTKFTMEIICISAGCLTIAVVLCVAPASFHNNTSKTSIQRTARIGFLIHAVTHNIAQVAIFSLGLISSTKIVQPITTMAVLVCLLAFAAMGSTVWACCLWFFILPLRFLRQRPEMVSNIGKYFDRALLIDVVYFVLFFTTIIPTVLLHEFRWTIRLNQFLVFMTTLLPLYVIPLAASLLHGIMTSDSNNRPCLSAMFALLRSRSTKVNDQSQRQTLSFNNNNVNETVITKLKFSVFIVLFLGTSAMVGALVIGLWDFAFEQPHIFYSILCLTGCTWECFILKIFFTASPTSSKRSLPSKQDNNNVVADAYQIKPPSESKSANTLVTSNMDCLETEIVKVRRLSLSSK